MSLRGVWRWFTGGETSRAPANGQEGLSGKGHSIRTDPSAESSSSSKPAFIARPSGAPVYHGFPILDESETDGSRLGIISDPTDSAGTDYLDGFVVAPDGSRAGLIWVRDINEISLVLGPTPDRWGVYNVPLPSGVNGEADLIAAFRQVLPELDEMKRGTPAWRCDKCGQENPRPFEVCWNCETEKPKKSGI
jgi:hypothetical protein